MPFMNILPRARCAGLATVFSFITPITSVLYSTSHTQNPFGNTISILFIPVTPAYFDIAAVNSMQTIVDEIKAKRYNKLTIIGKYATSMIETD